MIFPASSCNSTCAKQPSFDEVASEITFGSVLITSQSHAFALSESRYNGAVVEGLSESVGALPVSTQITAEARLLFPLPFGPNMRRLFESKVNSNCSPGGAMPRMDLQVSFSNFHFRGA